MSGFLKVKMKNGSKFEFNMTTEPSFKLMEGYVEEKEWANLKFKKVFVYKDAQLASYRIGPIDRSELEVINQ